LRERLGSPIACLASVLCSTVQRQAHPRLRSSPPTRPRQSRDRATLPPADTRRAGLLRPTEPPPQRPKPPHRKRGKAKRVHALSSFQRTKDPATRAVRPSHPRRHTFDRAAYQGQNFKLTIRLPAVSTTFIVVSGP
jgi:hypothetical protein